MMDCKQHYYDETGHCFECDAPQTHNAHRAWEHRKMDKMYAYFKDLPIGTIFHANGNECKKVSSRTASIDSPIAAGTFYWKMNDLCVVGCYSRLAN